ncbi:MAG: response regulator [Bacteroidetes bacterium]|nr:response regulator [Bacteroidota bacterium]
MKDAPIRILFVEDVSTDMELAIRELKKENVNFISNRVETASELMTQLKGFKPDVVISDYSMPSFTGLEALDITLKHSPGVPVILFTGSINEETAVSCIKAGATDYVLKDKIKRLPFALREALIQRDMKLDREMAEQALRESEQRYRTFLDSTADMAFIKDEKFRYILMNKANIEFIGMDESEIIGKDDFGLMEKVAAESCRVSDLKAIESNSIVITHEIILSRIFESRKFPVSLPNGKTGVGGFIREITDKVEAENQLRLQGAALTSAANAIVITNNKGIIISVNPAFTSLTGFTEEEVLGKNHREITKSGIHPDSFYKNLWETILSGKVWHGEMINRRKDGAFYNEEMTITPVHNNQGDISQFVAIKQNITERKIAELAIEASERKYRKLVDNAIIGIYTSNFEGEFLQVNEPLCKILESPSVNKLLKIQINQLYKYPDQRQVLLDSLMTTGKIMNHEVELLTTKGNERNVVINAILEGNQIIGMLVDITERKKNELELLKAKEKAEESDKLKTSFLANMSHEIRTPMNAILGYTELIISPEYADEEKHEYISVISKSSKQLLKIINDILEISKIATGQLTASHEQFILNDLLKEIHTENLPAANSKKLKFTFDFSLPNPASKINFDDAKLKQILNVLIDNAIKFSEKGSIKFGYYLKESILEFYVKDEGIGISKENQEIIFERFRQLEDSYTRKYGGSGLGLPIAKAFVELLGGSIRVESELGVGSTFTFSIPYIPVESAVKQNSSSGIPEDFQDYVFLVAEDDDINFVYMERLLMRTNAAIIRAANGKEAVDYCLAGNSVDLILMDINMPFMNGLEATHIIRERYPELPIIAVTAYSLSGDKETCISAGCNDYIAKPILRDELFRKLHQYLNT